MYDVYNKVYVNFKKVLFERVNLGVKNGMRSLCLENSTVNETCMCFWYFVFNSYESKHS